MVILCNINYNATPYTGTPKIVLNLCEVEQILIRQKWRYCDDGKRENADG
jgi:hypothetical protein